MATPISRGSAQNSLIARLWARVAVANLVETLRLGENGMATLWVANTSWRKPSMSTPPSGRPVERSERLDLLGGEDELIADAIWASTWSGCAAPLPTIFCDLLVGDQRRR